MNIALLGFGKMGQLINQLALQKGHHIAATADTPSEILAINFSNIDVAIDFSTPNSAYKNITTALQGSTPVVSGTTGWTEKLHKVHDIVLSNNTAFIHTTNFSIGVNIFFELNRYLSQIMKHQSDYLPQIEEIHHTEKLDKPSGTAITLQSHFDKQVPIKSHRIDNIIGTHCVNYSSEIDTISIQHEAHNRMGFAQGALLAAEWIVGKQGIFTMKDILNFNTKS